MRLKKVCLDENGLKSFQYIYIYLKVWFHFYLQDLFDLNVIICVYDYRIKEGYDHKMCRNGDFI